MEIGRLAAADVDAALALSEQAGWGTRRADWKRLVEADAALAVGGYRGDELVATATVAEYGDLGWVGCVLVDEDHRRRGLGTEIFEAAVDAAGVPVLGLDANPAGKPIYEASGFEAVAKVRQYTGTPDPARPPSVEAVDPSELDALVAFDRAHAGVDREWLLRSFAADPDAHLFVRRDGEVEGYALAHPDREGWNLGPVVAETPAAARALVRRAAAGIDGALTVRVPAAPTNGTVDWEALGFARERALDRMVRPAQETPLAGGAVRAIFAYAFG